MDDVKKDNLFSIRSSLKEKLLDGLEQDHFLVWGLRHTANVDKFLRSIFPQSLADDWMPNNPRMIMRLLMVRVDMNEHFKDPSFYDKFVCFIVAGYPSLGGTDNYIHSDFESRMSLYRNLEEQKVITTEDISKLTDILGDLDLTNLKEKTEKDFNILLKDKFIDTIIIKKFESVTSKLPLEITLPRIYYILEHLLNDNVNKYDLLSIYKSLKKRNTNIQCIIWALETTGHEDVVYNLQHLLPHPYPNDWMPMDPHTLIRRVLVHMDMNERFRDKERFIRSICQCNELIGTPEEYPHDNCARRMDLYRRLEELGVITPLNINRLLDSLRSTGMPELADKVNKDFCSSMKRKNLYISRFTFIVLLVTTIMIVPFLSLYIGSEVSSSKTSTSGSNITSLFERPSVEERIWIESESGEDVVKLCIEKIEASGIFPKDTTNDFMRRIAYTMSRDGNPPFQLTTDGGIWQVSLYAFSDTKNTEAHIRLNNTYNDTYISKYTKIKAHFDIDWPTVRRVDLAIPFYSALAARLYLSNFAEPFPPCYDIEKQSQYWWNKYLLNHESKQFYSLSSFSNSINELPPGCLKKSH
jgi:hypothetical protein